jgi:hypothetical protein
MNLDEEYWTTRFMYARRVPTAGAASDDDIPAPKQKAGRAERRTEARREAARVLGRLAGVLLRRYPRQ